jgi:hypothetical protein
MVGSVRVVSRTNVHFSSLRWNTRLPRPISGAVLLAEVDTGHRSPKARTGCVLPIKAHPPRGGVAKPGVSLRQPSFRRRRFDAYTVISNLCSPLDGCRRCLDCARARASVARYRTGARRKPAYVGRPSSREVAPIRRATLARCLPRRWRSRAKVEARAGGAIPSLHRRDRIATRQSPEAPIEDRIDYNVPTDDSTAHDDHAPADDRTSARIAPTHPGSRHWHRLGWFRRRRSARRELAAICEHVAVQREH